MPIAIKHLTHQHHTHI